MNRDNPKLKRFISTTLAFLLIFNVLSFLNWQKAHAAAATNLALNKPVTVSGTFSSYVGSNAVDGINSTFWSQSNTTTGGYLTVDLGTQTTFNSWEIYRGWYIMGIELQISSNGVNFSPINDPNASATMTPTQYYDSGVKYLSSPVSARYVRLVIKSNYDTYFRIYEFNLYNITAPSAPLNVSALGGVNQARISFDPPTSNGGAAITRYTVTSSPGNITASGTSSPITVTSLPAGDYTFTVKAMNISITGSSSTASNSVTVTAATSPEGTPTAGINYAAEQLTGLVPNGAYTINGTAVTTDGSGKAAINSSWLGLTVNVVKKGNGTTTTDSAAQTVSLPSRPATPTAGKTDETSINGNNGTLTNVTMAMEYQKGSGNWTSISGTTVTGLAPDTYAVRVKATSSAFTSVAQTVTIAAFTASSEPTPAAAIDYAAEQLTGLVPNGAYTINGTAVTADGNGKAAINSSWLGLTVNVVKKGNSTTTTDSASQTVSLPSRPATPTAGKTDETSINGNNGTLTNVTTAMEYKKGSGNWTNISGTTVTGLAPDTYAVRVKATSSAFASVAQTVTIAAFTASSEPTPAAEIDYAAEQLTGLVLNGAYTINGTAVTADGNGKAAINSSWLGLAVNVVKKGNSTTTTDSASQTLSLPARPAMPTAGKTDETSINGNNGTLTNVTSAMEYKKGSGNWTSISGTTVTGLAPDTYSVRVKATSSAFVSDAQTVTIAAFTASSEPTPAAAIDYAAEQLTGLVPNGAYTIDGTAVTADGNSKAAITSSWLGLTVNVVKKGNGTTTTDSAAQTLSLPSRPATPTAGKTDETSINGNNGTLTNVTSAMEYQKGSGNWTSISGTTVTGLAPDTYAVRVKATSSAFASVAQTVTIAAFTASSEPTPAAAIDYAAEQLTGLVPNGTYTINGTAVTTDGSGKAAINSSWLGLTVNVVKKGNGTTTTDSAAQTLSLPSRPATPTAGKTDETSINGNNGTLTNVTTAMEYKKGSGNWTSISGTTVTGLAPDTYSVRVKATSSAFASDAQTVTIAAFTASLEPTPAAAIDYAAEQLTGLVPNGAYTINGTAVTADGSGKAAINSSWLGLTVNVVKKGNSTTTTDSAAQTLSLPARPATPTAGKTDETSINGNNGTLTNVTTAMEYKKGSGNWTSISGTTVTGLAPDMYSVRVKATTSAFASVAQTVTIAAFTASLEPTPAAEIDYTEEQLTGLVPNGAYTINGTAVTADGSGKAAINSSWLGLTVNVVKKGNGTTTTDSAAQTLSLPSRPAAPVDITVTDITYNGANDGSILNVNLAMEFKIGNTGTWMNITGTSVVELAPGVYYVRVAATESAFASIPAQVTIHDSNAIIPAAPNVSADDASNAIVDLDTTMEFSVDGEAYVRYDGTNMPQLSGEHTVQVRVAASGSVPAGPSTTLIFTTNAAVPAGGLNVTAGDPSGAANDGKTRITVTSTVYDNHRLVYFNFGSGVVGVPNVGDTLSGYLNVPSDWMIPAANGDKIGIAEVDAQDLVVKFGQTAAIVIAEQPAPQPLNETSTGTAGSKEESFDVLVNGKVENAGKATTTVLDGVKTTTVVVDLAKLRAMLEAEGANAFVTIPVNSASNIIVGELNGQMVKNMENLSATIVLQTNKGTYTLPAKEINIDELAGKLGSSVKLEDILLKVTVAQTLDTMAKVVENAASKGELSVVVPAVDFTVTGTYGGKTVEVSTFNVYVERMVALPDGIDLNRITTGVVVDADGTVRHVPTKIVTIDGKSYAKINSLTNSTYTVVWHPFAFADVEKHWAKEAVNDMGARLVIHGVNDTTFNPDADITRAEFVAMIGRGLGLRLGEGLQSFGDVATNAWYASAIQTAVTYGLVSGFEDETFQPNAKITREQAMVIIAKAMKLTGLAKATGAPDKDALLGNYADSANMGTWAIDSITLAAKAGLISGRSGGKLEAKANVTRAEVATLIQRLLKQSNLI
ncbi:hypothetical protein GC096_35235 [Paenibacillus sp. LMG 31461]|uniref:S-layer homology domain-containing protein n=1 Tax=Paenibacillus plantarum TaxID=2654975 RepID=A0ABX1XN73_9BACL|nr:S-layer homology domain-containing protein [Paenibacillus plantarum]NOU69274.1 hypothetical protein [Paenibacillus plantarum]